MGEQRDPIVEAARRLVAVWDERQFGLMSWHALVGAAYVELRDTIMRASLPAPPDTPQQPEAS